MCTQGANSIKPYTRAVQLSQLLLCHRQHPGGHPIADRRGTNKPLQPARIPAVIHHPCYPPLVICVITPSGSCCTLVRPLVTVATAAAAAGSTRSGGVVAQPVLQQHLPKPVNVTVRDIP
jgi:hypothetical protein